MRRLLFLIVFISINQLTTAQVRSSKQIKAYKMGMEAVTLMDKGLIKKSLQLLKKSKRLDPKNYKYEYERGYAYYLAGDLDKAIDIFHDVLTYEFINDKCHYMLGHFYTEQGDTTLAISTLKEGLAMFPRSGKIRNALGILTVDHEEALYYFEAGIKQDPSFAANYYYACKVMDNSPYSLKRALYGEIFMNYERNSERTKEVSRIVFDSYAQSIDYSDSNYVQLNFGSYVMRELPGPIDSIDIPLEAAIGYIFFETLDSTFIRRLGPMNIATMTTIKTEFIREWYYNRFDDAYTQPLFAFQKRLLDLGLLHEYNRWLFMGANSDAFEAWHKRNKQRFGAFARWFSEHELDTRRGTRPVRNRSVNLSVDEL